MGDAVAALDVAYGGHRVQDGNAGAGDDTFSERRQGRGRAVGDREGILGREGAGCWAESFLPRGRTLVATALVEVSDDRERTGGTAAQQGTPCHRREFLGFVDHDMAVCPRAVFRGTLGQGRPRILPGDLVREHLSCHDAAAQVLGFDRFAGALNRALIRLPR